MAESPKVWRFLKGKLDSLLAPAEDPRPPVVSLDQRGLDLLDKLRRAQSEVTATKQQLVDRVEPIAEKLPSLYQQARRAVAGGREDLARVALQRRQAVLRELRHLEREIAELTQEEQRLALAEDRLTTHLDTLRTRQEIITARHSSAEAQLRLQEALAGLSQELVDLGSALVQAEATTERLEARTTAIDELVQSGALPADGRSPGDPLDRRLAALDDARAAEVELEALRRQIGPWSDRSTEPG